MLACRNTRPGFVQRWPTNRSPAVRSVRRWKPRSLTSKPGVVVLSANPQLELPPSLLMERSAATDGSRNETGTWVAPDLAPHPRDNEIRERLDVFVPPGTAGGEARLLSRRHRVEHAHRPPARRLTGQLRCPEDGRVRRQFDEPAWRCLRFERGDAADAT